MQRANPRRRRQEYDLFVSILSNFQKRFCSSRPFWTSLLFLMLVLTPPPGGTEWRASGNMIKLDLNKAFIIGLTNSFLLKGYEGRQDVAKMLITEKWREFLPKVGVSYFGLGNININQQDTVYNDVRLTLQQLVWDGGEASLNLKIAELQERLTKEDFLATYDKIKYLIREAYFDSLSKGARFDLKRKSLERASEQLRVAKLEFQQGFITELQLIETAAKVREIEFGFLKTQNEYKQSIHLLRGVLNLDPKIEITLSENLYSDFSIKPPILTLKDAVGRSVSERHDVRKSRLSLEKAKDETKIAENYWMPKLYLGGYLGRNSTDGFPLRHDIYGVNFAFSMPIGSSTVQTQSNLGIQTAGSGIQRYGGYGNQIVGQGESSYTSSNVQFFDNLSHSRKIVEGKLNLIEALNSQREIELKAEIEINKDYDNVVEAWQMIRVANSRILLKYRELSLTSTKIGLGQAKLVDLLGAEVEMTKAQDDLLEALLKYINSWGKMELDTAGQIVADNYVKFLPGSGNTIINELFSNGKSPAQSKVSSIPIVDLPAFESDSLQEEGK